MKIDQPWELFFFFFRNQGNESCESFRSRKVLKDSSFSCIECLHRRPWQASLPYQLLGAAAGSRPTTTALQLLYNFTITTQLYNIQPGPLPHLYNYYTTLQCISRPTSIQICNVPYIKVGSTIHLYNCYTTLQCIIRTTNIQLFNVPYIKLGPPLYIFTITIQLFNVQ